ncbi:MAG: amino acid transporter [Lasallia pustulata]|uniref:Amino acid transporter n=1 Tax=Lasallia pustulata TaxID=136370 RepID=A0A5M8PHV1_9LECA|nr:MAG: amino acid transporter [Lasallia pustulata]
MLMRLSEPTAGGQYHWVRAFAPPGLQKPASFIVGWMCALGWQSYVPGAANICASIIVGFAVVSNDSYVPHNWHIVTLTVLICSFAIVFNVFLARKLPGIEAAVFTMYILAFVAFFVVFLALGPRSSAKEIFTDFQDNAGWGSIGTACFVGVSAPVITLIGSDSAVHLAEELKDASRQLPNAMLGTAGVNFLLGFMMLIAFIAVVGNVDQLLQTATGQPWIQVLWNATQSRNATMTMTFFVIFFFLFCAVNQNTTSSRQLYAFSRDGGLPFSRWISYVSPTRNVPVHAVLLTWLIGCGLGLIPLGSTAAFLNIQTIGNSGLLISYIICIACRLHHRNTVGIYGNLPAKPPFTLGKWGGNIINTVALLFLLCFLISDMFPTAPNPDTSSMNWNSLVLGVTVVIAGISYIWLRKTYLGADDGSQIELTTMQIHSKGSRYEQDP